MEAGKLGLSVCRNVFLGSGKARKLQCSTQSWHYGYQSAWLSSLLEMQPSNLRVISLEMEKLNFPCLQKHALEIAGGMSLEVGNATQEFLETEGPDPVQEEFQSVKV